MGKKLPLLNAFVQTLDRYRENQRVSLVIKVKLECCSSLFIGHSNQNNYKACASSVPIFDTEEWEYQVRNSSPEDRVPTLKNPFSGKEKKAEM